MSPSSLRPCPTLALLIVSILLVAVAGPLQATSLLEAPFSDGTSNGWTVFEPGWSVSDGKYHSTNTGANVPVESVWQAGYSWDDYLVEADVRALDGYEPADVGLVFRYQSGIIGADDNLKCRLSQFGGRSLQLLTPEGTAQVPFAYQTGQWYRLRATARGNRVTCEVVGQPGTLLTRETTGSLSGTIGLRATHIRGDFDNVLVSTWTGGGYYPFDEGAGSVALDATAAHNDGAVHGATWVQGRVGGALHFGTTPTADRVDLPDTLFDGFTNTAYLEAWIRPSSYPDGTCAGTIFRKRAAYNDASMELRNTASGYFSGNLRCDLAGSAGGSWSGVAVVGGTIPLGEWSRVACWYDGSTMRGYVNGVEVARQDAVLTPDWGPGPYSSYRKIEIGNDTVDTGINCPDYGFRGDIDQVVVAQAPADAAALAAGVVAYWPFDGNARDATGNGYDGTPVGDVSWAPGILGEAAQFDGIGDYIAVSGHVAYDNEFSVCGWMKRDGDGENLYSYMFIKTSNVNYAYQSFGYYADASIATLHTDVSDFGSPWYLEYPVRLDLHRWYHLCTTVEPGDVRIYVDGALVAQQPLTGVLDPGTFTGNYIGGFPQILYGPYSHNGLFDDVVVFNRAITPGEVSLLGQDADQDGVADFWRRPNLRSVRLVDSQGHGVPGATVTYYHSGWQPLGTTDADGRVTLAISPENYSFRVEYAGASVQRSQDLRVAPEVLFQTTDVTVALRDSAGQALDSGAAEYYAGGWKSIGSTVGGLIHKELLPTSYSFAMSYGGARVQKVQDVSGSALVTFQTRDIAVELRDSADLPLDTGTVDYYAGGWKPFGSTVGGVVHKELLPTTYTFAMSHAGGRVQKTQDVTGMSTVAFQTRDVSVHLLSSSGGPLDAGVVEYYAGGWKPFGTTTGGMVHKELLPTSYSFAMSYSGGRVQKVQDVSGAAAVSFQTRDVTVQLLDSHGDPLDSGSVDYYAAGWKPFGTTAGGSVHRDLLPTSYTFAMSYAGGRVQKAQDVSTNSTVAFQTGSVVSDSSTCNGYYASGWRAFTQGMQLLPASYTFRFSSGSPSQSTAAITSGVENHIR